MKRLLISLLKTALVAVLTLFQAFPPAALAKSAVKVQTDNGQIDFSTPVPSVVLEGIASHLENFEADGEIELIPGPQPGSLVGEGPVVFEAANGDLLVGIMMWDLESVGTGHIHFSWRDAVQLSDGTIVSSTGRFVDERPPGALIAVEWIFIATIIVLGIITG